MTARARGVVESTSVLSVGGDVKGGRVMVTLTHGEYAREFAPGDVLYTSADLPELVGSELRKLGVPPQVDDDERKAIGMFMEVYHSAGCGVDEAPVPAFCLNVLSQMFERLYPEAAKKSLGRTAFEAALVSKHVVDSPEYWADVAAAVVKAHEVRT